MEPRLLGYFHPLRRGAGVWRPAAQFRSITGFADRRTGLRCAVTRQVSVLRAPCVEPRFDLGVCGDSKPRSGRLLRFGWLLHGHVPDAADRYPRSLWQSAAARLHGLPQLEGAAVVLVGV